MKNNPINNFCSSLKEFTNTLEDYSKAFDAESRKTESVSQLDALILETCERILDTYTGDAGSIRQALDDMRKNAQASYEAALQAVDALERQSRLYMAFLAIDLTTRIRSQRVPPDRVLDGGEPEFVHPCDLSESGVLKRFGGVSDPDTFAAIVNGGGEE